MNRRSQITRKVQVKRRRTGPPRRSARVLDPDYLDFLRTLPCWVCARAAYRMFRSAPGLLLEQTVITTPIYDRQKSPTEAAHVGLSTSRRGASQKYPDPESLPLCECEHHQHGPESIHALGAERFFAHHGADRDTVIRSFQALYAEHCR